VTEVLELGRMRILLRPVQLALLAEGLGIVEDVRTTLAAQPDTRYVMIARRIVDGDLLRAADELEETQSMPSAADARVHAARSLVAAGRRAEADEQLRRALDFYRSAGATRYVREAEQLLTATA
jgi:hypothetical protein